MQKEGMFGDTGEVRVDTLAEHWQTTFRDLNGSDFFIREEREGREDFDFEKKKNQRVSPQRIAALTRYRVLYAPLSCLRTSHLSCSSRTDSKKVR